MTEREAKAALPKSLYQNPLTSFSNLPRPAYLLGERGMMKDMSPKFKETSEESYYIDET